jgi:hypothetical protein
VELASGNDEAAAESSVGVNAQHLQFVATVAAVLLAGKTVGVIDVRFHAAAITDGDRVDIAANLKDFDTEFVSWDAWVAIEGKFPQVTA